MQGEGIRHLIVTEGKRLPGVLSERGLGGREGSTVRRRRTAAPLTPAYIRSVGSVLDAADDE